MYAGRLWLAFFAAAWAISFSPGPGAVAVMTASLSHGSRAAISPTFGLAARPVDAARRRAPPASAQADRRPRRSPSRSSSGSASPTVIYLRRAPVARRPDRRCRAATARAVRDDAAAGSSPKPGCSTPSIPRARPPCCAVVPQFLTPARAAPAAVPRRRRDADLQPILVVNALYAAPRGASARPASHARRGARAVNRVFGGLFVTLGVLLAGFDAPDRGGKYAHRGRRRRCGNGRRGSAPTSSRRRSWRGRP